MFKIRGQQPVISPIINLLLYKTSVAWGQVWTQKCAVQKASVDVNISYY